jgi:hypothetical protein
MYLAQVNVGRLRHPLEAPESAGFRDGSIVVLAVADGTRGYLGRRHRVGDDIPGIESDPSSPLVVNVSLWTDYETLHAFTYGGFHGRYLTDRMRWFQPVEGRTAALWWHPKARVPDVDAGIARLVHLRRYGPTPEAFTMRRRFTPEGRPEPATRR